jgi:hypothetical protein
VRANPPYALRDVAIAHMDPTVRSVMLIEVRFNPMDHERHARFA